MATIYIQDRVLDAAGDPVSVGCTVTAYGINADGTLGAQVGSSQTPDADGEYSFSLSTGTYNWFAVKIVAGADVRWRYPNVKLMVEEISGPGGVAPIPNSSVTTAKLASGAVNDTIIGNRTVNQALTGGSNTGTLTQILSWLSKAIVAISGESNWYTSPTKGSLIDKIRNGGNVPRITSSTSRGTATEAEEVKIVTSGVDKGLWQYTGGQWVEIANVDGSGGAAVDPPYGFRYIVANGTTVTADQEEDTLTLNAGSGILLSASASGDSITISASGGSGGSGTANTVRSASPSSSKTFSSSSYSDVVEVDSASDTTGGSYLITVSADVEALSANTQWVGSLHVAGVAQSQQMVFTSVDSGGRAVITSHWIVTLGSGTTTCLLRGKVDSGSARVASGGTRISAIKIT